VASCSPKTHEPMFRETLEACGINKYLFEMANIRNQNSWVHAKSPELATRKAKDLIRMAVARAGTLKPLRERVISVVQRALVIGGGVAGMNAALSLARQGFDVALIEKEPELGGYSRNLHHTIEGGDIPAYVERLIREVRGRKDPGFHGRPRRGFRRIQGKFRNPDRRNRTERSRPSAHGVIIVATGAKEYRPEEYLYGKDERVMTQVELAHLLEEKGAISPLGTVVMIQCVGSRNEEYPECSRICCQNAVKNALRIKETQS
jgi:heterodisulfide reductase subunit A2